MPTQEQQQLQRIGGGDMGPRPDNDIDNSQEFYSDDSDNPQ